MAVVIAITNQKGGVGKTTTCAAFCGGLTESGKSVLADQTSIRREISASALALTQKKAILCTMYSRETAP